MKKQGSDTEKLKEKLKSGEICGIYLLTGEERYGRKTALNKIKSFFEDDGFSEFNIGIFDGDELKPDVLLDFVQTYPVMSEKKLAVIKNSGAFKKPSKALLDAVEEIIKTLPDYIAVVFDEDSIDGRSGLLKKIKAEGVFAEFKYKTQGELVSWCKKLMQEEGIEISDEAVSHLVFVCDEGMENLKNETEKLIAYCSEKKKAEISDIDKVVRKSLQNRIFDMIDAITRKRRDEAYTMLSELLQLKEEPIKIIILISRQVIMLLRTSSMTDDGRASEIASKLKLAPFIARKYMDNARLTNTETLSQYLSYCLEADSGIKEGRIAPESALEILIAKMLA